MYSWSGIGVPTTKAIIRESARLVNLTLGRAGFLFAPQAPTRRATSGTNRGLPRSAYHAIQKSRDGVVFAIANLHPSQPLTSGFLGYSVYADGTRNLRFPSRRLRQHTPKTAFFSVPNPLILASASAVAAADHALAA